MQIDYKRDLNHNYMIITEEGEPNAASYQIRMLQTNSISGILECRMHKMNNHTLFYYDITSRQALNSIYDHQQVGFRFLRLLFQQLVNVLEELGSYLLDPEGLILSPKTVYLAAEPLQFSFCYLPGEKHSVNEQMRELMEYLLPRLDHREPETVVLGYGLYKAVSDTECSLNQIRSVLCRETEVPVQTETFAEEKQEAREKQEGMKKKAMESFFKEDEEEEKESVVWTIGAIAGGAAILGLLLYLIYVTDVPAFMYLILLAAAGVSVLVVSLWLRKKEQDEAEEEMRPFLVQEQEKAEQEDAPRIQTGAETFFHPSYEKQRETLTKPPMKSPENHRYYQGEWGDTEKREKRKAEDAAEESEKIPERQSPSQLLYQKTEPLFIQPRRNHFFLVPLSGPELPEIMITKEETTIGKLGTAADAVIPIPTVSRLHAKLHCAQGICLLTDLNSCNGTYVNGVQLEGDIPRKLEDGDEIAFANVKYRFLEK